MAAIRLPKEYHRVQRHMQKAIMRGDIAAAFQWLQMLERLVRIAQQETDLYYPQRKHRPLKPEKEVAPRTIPGYRNPYPPDYFKNAVTK